MGENHLLVTLIDLSRGCGVWGHVPHGSRTMHDGIVARHSPPSRCGDYLMKIGKQLLMALAACWALLGVQTASAATIVGGSTSVSLTAAPTLQGLGLTISNTGMSFLLGTSPPVATFLISGGSVNGGNSLIEHEGSGLLFTAGANSLAIGNFLIDTSAGILSGDVVANGASLMDVPLFNIGPGLTLLLTSQGAGAFTSVFGAPDLTGATIGTATTNPIIQAAIVPEPETWAIMIFGFFAVGIAMRNRKIRTNVLAHIS
ncbi:MAG: PEPxxWA-CTERM sorting domain-containing protein [Parasphingorhabdus sp.]|nr:PEPxxWA-CTERM sorting domain-containing protein [Parasphingorhabdus sp.]